MKEGWSGARLIDFLHHKPRRWINVLSGESKSFIINVVHPSINRRGDRKQTKDRHPSLTVSTPQCLIISSFSIVQLSAILFWYNFWRFPIQSDWTETGQRTGAHCRAQSTLIPLRTWTAVPSCPAPSLAVLSGAVSVCRTAVVRYAPEKRVRRRPNGARHLMSASCTAKMKWWFSWEPTPSPALSSTLLPALPAGIKGGSYVSS